MKIKLIINDYKIVNFKYEVTKGEKEPVIYGILTTKKIKCILKRIDEG